MLTALNQPAPVSSGCYIKSHTGLHQEVIPKHAQKVLAEVGLLVL